jgi:hypothetical protein
MRPYLFLPFVREALEKKFEEDAFIDVYATNTHLVAQGGGLRRLKVVVRKAPKVGSPAINWSTSLAGGMGFLSCILSV